MSFHVRKSIVAFHRAVIETLEMRTLLTATPYENRGAISIIVDGTIAANISSSLKTYESDLVGDGWTYYVHNDAPRMKDNQYVWDNFAQPPHAVTPTTDASTLYLDDYKAELATVKGMIASDAAAATTAGTTLKSVVLVGHVTVPYSGDTIYDGHLRRAMPTDQYYADLDGTPETWGDYHIDLNSFTGPYDGVDYSGDNTEVTRNNPADGRFDADSAPGDAQAITVGGTGPFTLTVGGYTTQEIAYKASADAVRDQLNLLSSVSAAGLYTTVTLSSGVYEVRFIGAGSPTPPTITGSSPVSVSPLTTGGLELSVGRIDMANLQLAFGRDSNGNPELDEATLLNNYFARDHNFRTAAFRPTSKALVQADASVAAVGANPDFSSALGVPNVDLGSWYDDFVASNSTPTNYLFASRTGYGGLSQFINGPSNFGSYNVGDYSSDNVGPDFGVPARETPVRAVFTMEGGSFMGDWNNRSFRNTYYSPDAPLPRAMIAGNYESSPTLTANDGEGLVSMSLDELNHSGATTNAAAAGLIRSDVLSGSTTGEGFREAINSTDSSIYQEFLGDPTLRLQYVAPPDVSASPVTEKIDLGTGNVTITWPLSLDNGNTGFSGYDVYRASSLDGTFGTPINSTRISGTTSTLSFTDTSPGGDYVYMVRAIATTSLGGSAASPYTNASTGVFATKVILYGSSGADQVGLVREGDNVYLSGKSTHSGRLWTFTPYPLDVRTTQSIEFDGNDGDDVLSVDYSGGQPVPGGLTYDGGTGTNELSLGGNPGVADTSTFSSGLIVVNGDNFALSSVQTIRYGDSGGGDITTVNGGPTVMLDDANDFASLTIGATGSVAVEEGDGLLINVHTLSIATGGTLDLADNDLIVGSGTSKATIEGYVRTARDGGAWDGSGITSSAAKDEHDNYDSATGLAVVGGGEYMALDASNTEFEGQTLSSTDTIIKYTYNGDADLNGVINAADYHQIDDGYQNQSNTGFVFDWLNGDFDYNGTINFGDYALIDQAYQHQNGELGHMIAYLNGVHQNATVMATDGMQRVQDHLDLFGDDYRDAVLALVGG